MSDEVKYLICQSVFLNKGDNSSVKVGSAPSDVIPEVEELNLLCRCRDT